MNRELIRSALVALVAVAPATGLAADWLDFRGGDGFVAAADAAPPADWSVEEGRNIAWAVDLPARGVSGPIVVGDRVIVTGSDGPNRERLHVAAYAASDGRLLWRRRMWATGRTLCHGTSAVAAPTPASDGERVFVFFSSNDTAAFDRDGRLLWHRPLTLDHPRVGNDVGMASSPVVAGDAVVVQAECKGESFAIALDRVSGATLWEVERPRDSNWTSPLAIDTEAGPAVLLQGSDGVLAIGAESGEELWRFDSPCSGIPSLTRLGDRLVIPSEGLAVVALESDAEAATDESAPSELWRSARLKPGSPSPVAWDGRVLVINRAGVLTCGDLATGDNVWRRRLGGRFWATPVVAAGRAYCVNSDGKAFVVDLESGEVIAEPAFGEDVLATPAISGDALYVRAYERLWKIATPRVTAAGAPERDGSAKRR